MGCNKTQTTKNKATKNTEKDTLEISNKLLRAKNDSLLNLIKSKTTSDVILNPSVIGGWTLDYNAYDYVNMSLNLKNYLKSLKKEISEFNFIFNSDSTMYMDAVLINKNNEITRTNAIYSINESKKIIEIERDTSDFVADEAVQKYYIISVTENQLILKSDDIILILKKDNSKIRELF